MHLRRILILDAVTCVGTGLLLALFAVQLEPLLGLPYTLLQYAGLALLPIAAFMTWLGLRSDPWKAGVWTVILGNALWVAGSLALIGWLSPTRVGTVFILAQAFAVALLAVMEYLAQRRSSPWRALRAT
jgi:hypothetical protein